MHLLKGVVPAALFCIFSIQIAAAATPLSLQDAVWFALSHNTAIAAKRVAMADAQAAYTKQHAQELPNITGTLQNTLSRSSNAGGAFAQYGVSPQSRFSQNTAQIGTQWQLYNGSLNQIIAQEDRRRFESARADLRQTQAQITNNIVSAFFGVSSKEFAYSVAQKNLAYQQSLLTVAQAKERAGLVAGVDVLRADTAVQQSLAANLGAQSDVQSAREALALLIGARLDTEFTASQALPEPALPAQPLATLVEIAERNRPDVAVAAASLAIARLNRSAIDSDLRPQITLNGSFGNQMSPTTAVTQQTQIDNLNASCAAAPIPKPAQCAGFPFSSIRGTPGFWQIGATTTLAFPLIDYGTRRTAHSAADEAIDSAELGFTGAKTAAEADVRQSLRNAQTAAASLVYQKRAASLATESARIAQLQYRNGLISLTDVTAAQNTAISAQTDLFNARVAYINAIVKLRTALGTLEPAGIVSDL